MFDMVPEDMMLMNGGGAWTPVTAPDAAFNYVPFTIQQKGRSFRPDPAFSLQTHANITVAKTYYVDIATGNDANSGLDWANALVHPYYAMVKADVDRVYIKAGTYNILPWSPPIRSMEIIAYGGDVTLSYDYIGYVGAFTPSAAHYYATVGSAKVVVYMWDAHNLDSVGEYTILVNKASEAEVDATAGSWYQSGTTIYVHTIDSRAPDANLKYYGPSWVCSIAYDNIKIYCEGIKFYGGNRAAYIQNSSSAGGLKVYFKGCEFKYTGETAYSVVGFQGIDEVILQNCLGAKSVSSDVFNYHVKNGVISKVIEINCEARNSGSGSTDQASTVHDGISVVRINGKYHDVTGQCIADSGPTPGKVWMLGAEVYNSGTGYGFYSECENWLDSCYSHDNATVDLVNTAGITTHIRNFIGAKGVNQISGTLATY